MALLFQLFYCSDKVILRLSCVTDVLLEVFYQFFVLFLEIWNRFWVIMLQLTEIRFGTGFLGNLIRIICFILLGGFNLFKKELNDFLLFHKFKILTQAHGIVLTLVFRLWFLSPFMTVIHFKRELIVVWIVDSRAASSIVKVPSSRGFGSRKTYFSKAIIVVKHERFSKCVFDKGKTIQ